MAMEFVPSAVIEKASFRDMIYAACPKCFTSMNSHLASDNGAAGTELLRVQCSSCGTCCRLDQLQFKYRLKLKVMYGSTVADAMLFDEAAEKLLGVSASRMKSEILLKHPSLPQLLEELLVGLRVSFSFQRPAPKRNAKQAQLTRDLKIISMEPLIPNFYQPAATFAINLLQQHSSGDHLAK